MPKDEFVLVSQAVGGEEWGKKESYIQYELFPKTFKVLVNLPQQLSFCISRLIINIRIFVIITEN